MYHGKNTIMTIKATDIKGVFEIQLETREDFRGFLMETDDDRVFKKHGINTIWVKEYQNFSLKKGTIRGLHFQLPPYAQAKLVRVIQGETLYVFVDLRKDSPTLGKWARVILSAENKKMLYIPRGFAHAFCSLADNTMAICKMDNPYSPESEYQIKWNDPDLNIDWQLENTPIVSPKDSSNKSFKEFIAKHGAIKI